MKTAYSTKALALFIAGIFCAAVALSAFGGGKHVAPDTESTVVVTETKLVSGETLPVVTVTAKKLSMTEKIVLAMRDRAGNRS